MIELTNIPRKSTRFNLSISGELEYGFVLEIDEPAGLFAVGDALYYDSEYNILYVNKRVMNGNTSEIYCPKKNLEEFKTLIEKLNEIL